MSGGEGPSNEFKPPEHTQPGWEGYVRAGEQLASQPYQQYMGMRVAPMNDRQMTAGQLLTDKMLYSDPQTQAARGSLMNISQGGAKNPFMDNAYTEQMIGNNARNMTDSFLGGTAMNNDALAARQGAFGGSAHTAAQQSGAANLANQVGQMATSTRQAEIGRKGGLWNDSVNQILQANSMAPAFSNLDHQDIAAGLAFGNQERDYMQKLFDEPVNEFDRQQNHPWQQLDRLGSILGRASTGYGTNTAAGQSGGMNALGGGLGLLGMLLG